MESVGIRDLQQNAGRVVARAAAGETIVVTDRGRAVARLVPERPAGLAALRAAGRMRAPTRSLGDLPRPLPAEPGRRTLGELLGELRADER
jgi:prevent-host-death family protein